jgi:hypothetical protein
MPLIAYWAALLMETFALNVKHKHARGSSGIKVREAA